MTPHAPPRGETPAIDQARLNRVFAATQGAGVRIGLVLMIVGFTLYVSGVPAPFLPVEELGRHWGLDADSFTRATGLPTGWGWTALLPHSDMLGLAGLAWMALVVVAAYAALLPVLLRSRDWIYFWLVVAQLAVFAAAAGGWLAGGG